MSGHHSAGDAAALNDNQLITAEQLKPRLNDVIVVDVRSAEEIAQSGRVGSKTWANIPLPELADALKLPPSEFQKKYSISKPDDSNDEIVFHCAHGRRGGKATALADSLGFKKSVNLVGGQTAWKNAYPEN